MLMPVVAVGEALFDDGVGGFFGGGWFEVMM